MQIHIPWIAWENVMEHLVDGDGSWRSESIYGGWWVHCAKSELVSIKEGDTARGNGPGKLNKSMI